MPNALISVSNKNNILNLSTFLLNNNFNLYCSDGTYKYLVQYFSDKIETYLKNINTISSITNFPEILNGRVKTLHPKIYGGILADVDNDTHINDITTHDIDLFKVIVVNLYPFEDKNCVENIDIGGVSLLRAGSKNYKNISVLSNPYQYSDFINMYNSLNNSLITSKSFVNYNKKLASIAFDYISNYDRLICNFLKNDNQNDNHNDNNDNQNKDNQNKDNQNKDDQNKDDQKKPKENKNQQSKLSPQQIKNLLKAMENAEKKVQAKVNDKKQKGTKVVSEKDW